MNFRVDDNIEDSVTPVLDDGYAAAPVVSARSKTHREVRRQFQPSSSSIPRSILPRGAAKQPSKSANNAVEMRPSSISRELARLDQRRIRQLRSDCHTCHSESSKGTYRKVTQSCSGVKSEIYVKPSQEAHDPELKVIDSQRNYELDEVKVSGLRSSTIIEAPASQPAPSNVENDCDDLLQTWADIERAWDSAWDSGPCNTNQNSAVANGGSVCANTCGHMTLHPVSEESDTDGNIENLHTVSPNSTCHVPVWCQLITQQVTLQC